MLGNKFVAKVPDSGGKDPLESFAKDGGKANGAVICGVGEIFVGLGDHTDDREFPRLGEVADDEGGRVKAGQTF